MSKKLLLADDSVTIQKVIGITFAQEDYQLTVADNGDAALEKAREIHPDLILADVFMPGKNGYELCEAIKKDPDLKNLPVLLLAGTFEPFDKEKAREAGAEDWIVKPFESQALIGKVEELLARKPVAAPAAEPAPSTAAEVTGRGPAEKPVAAAEEPAAEGEFELWDDLAAEEPGVGEVASESPGELGGGEEPAAAGGEDEEDFWGDISFDEEDLAGEAEELGGPESTPDELWEDFEEEPGAFGEEAFAEAKEPAGVSGDPFDFGGEDEFAFEEDFAQPEPAEPEAGETQAEGLAFEEPETEEPAAEVTVAGEEELPEVGEEAFDFSDEGVFGEEGSPGGEMAAEAEGEFAWEEEPEGEILPLGEGDILEEEDLEPVSGVATEPIPGAPAADEAALAGTAAEAVGAVEPSPEEESPAAENPEKASPPSAAAATADAEARAGGLSEEELERIVEKVAGRVVERLADSVLEKVAWEVVPDLAESLIREELRRIKEGAENMTKSE